MTFVGKPDTPGPVIRRNILERHIDPSFLLHNLVIQDEGYEFTKLRGSVGLAGGLSDRHRRTYLSIRASHGRPVRLPTKRLSTILKNSRTPESLQVVSQLGKTSKNLRGLSTKNP